MRFNSGNETRPRSEPQSDAKMPQRAPEILRRSLALTLQNYGVAVVLSLFLCLLFLPWFLVYLAGALFLASLIAPTVENWRPRERVPPHGKAVFISGCDSGFGHHLARRLHDLGFEVFAGCLFPEGEGAQVLKIPSNRLHVLPLDVTSEDSVQKAAKFVVQSLGNKKLWAVVNNAGLNAGAEMMWTPLSVMEQIFSVNTFGVMRVTKAFLPTLCRDKGRVVTVASAAGRYTFPGLVPYCMTKQATVSFCEGLRIEMARFGVKVITIEPWMYRTPITHEENVLNYVTKAWDGSPEEVKKLYPENYIEKYKRCTLKFLRWSISERPQDVVSVMEEAVMAEDPKYSYMPGKLFSRLMFCVLSRLPKPVADAAIHKECVLQFT